MMIVRPKPLVLALYAIVGIAGTISLARTIPAQPKGEPVPSWIWLKGEPREGQTVRFRKTFEVPTGVVSAQLVAACDNDVTVFLDGQPVAQGNDWAAPIAKDLSGVLVGTGRNRGKGGPHILAAVCKNEGGPAGLIMRLTIKTKTGATAILVSDDTWKAVEGAETSGWAKLGFVDASWANASVVAPLGGGPWTAVTAAVLDSTATHGGPQAPSPDGFKVAKGFKVERLYTVPKDEQGSWVNMTTDPKGRLIVSDQYGKLYRVTPPEIGGDPATIKVEPIEVALGEAQGLLWAFDSLYVVVNRGAKYESGLYRVKDTNGDDTLDTVEKLRTLQGGGEHGPHAVILSPDGKSLHVIAGNDTKLTELAGSLVPRIYGEDQILPYMTDGNGFMAGERAPGGCIYRVDPEGKNWELVSMGYRNPFDMAFNRHGDLFTYDSDMEWDVNTPWYRPTRVCQADSGSDLGYRNGSGKWPAYYPDSLPPTINIGPGSPTGVTFGYGAKFPAKYQDALFICDWSYGKLYAVHMTPDASSYKAELEEFISGTPLPLTDVVINPKDKAMYFAIGGRKTLSGLYRVTYAGPDSTAPSKEDASGAEARALRHSLEAFHGHKDAKAVDAAWPYLGHADRFIRYAARVAIEFQDAKEWQDRALAESDPQASLTVLMAVARAGTKELQAPLIHSLGRLDWGALSVPQKLEALRVLELAVIRMGTPDEKLRAGIITHLDSLFPAKGRELNAELCKLLIALEAPSAATKTMALLVSAPTQEEQMEYVTALRKLRTGWTPELRKTYFSWFPRATKLRGGASLGGFIRKMKEDAVATLSAEEKTALRPILEAPPESKATIVAAAPRPFVKTWKLEDLNPALDKGLSGRDFDRGRTLFAAANCFACHRFDNEGGSVGPDLTGVSGRFSSRDLLESIVVPSKSVSDQYQAVTIATTDGRVVTGRIVNLNGDSMSINTDMLDPSAMTNINRNQVEATKPSAISMMPEGLLNTLKEDEILDLMAYLLSRGDRNSQMFK
ncbi:MAG: putative heme-binding protein [Planctomycetota bacterium]|nr:putative heme-binding protein [Planctomycetota bacterium]